MPYGSWPSRWSAADAAAASCDFAGLQAGLGGLLWLEYRPDDGRCRLWLWRDGAVQCLTPPGRSVRSRVYEYGGGAFCIVEDGVAWVDETDQQVYRTSVVDALAAEALTAQADCRYGDLHYAPGWSAVLAVEENHAAQAVVHRLVALSLHDGTRRVLAEGADFYSAPRLSADGRRLAWIEWDRPELPWTATRLCLAEVVADGPLGKPVILAGLEGGEALQQPCFAADGRLWCLSDRAGWWQPWAERGGQWHPAPGAGYPAENADAVFHPTFEVERRVDNGAALSTSGGDWSEPRPLAAADHAPAPWLLGTVSYLPLAEGHLLLTCQEEGWGFLIERDGAGRERYLATEFSRFRQLAADEEHFYCIAGSPTRLPAVLAIERAGGALRLLAGGDAPLAEVELSWPQSLRFATGEGESAQAFFYPPRNAASPEPEHGRPPLLVFVHGGPTSACYPVFDPRIQFWTQRGFAVADLNYRGSSGFGRAYRLRLAGEWGRIDVEDACALVRDLGGAGLIDPARAFIRGASAGGYTALCALAFRDLFRGGASLYGISDPLSLRRVTHKFEGDYLDWLIGDPGRDAERYRQRTPLLHAGRIAVPVIFFQGGLDAVVVPQQTETMVAALRAHGVAVEYRLYPDERHGFRQAAHLADALEREWRFYVDLLD
ncbi:alpha/beta hydrolase family protein [Azotobacter chroococcum]|uniref:alpha/beta hydrolase family protein n=1 Tax=Azotobacter chroococcum TaxID=353 RepID=UPI001939AFE6|nr:S9 family peptidase [Azotobacter chroococcum]